MASDTLSNDLLIVFARHGDYDRRAMSLDRDGRSQVLTLANIMKEKMALPPSAIYSGPSERATESAEILGQRLGTTFTQHKFLDVDSDLAGMAYKPISRENIQSWNRYLTFIQGLPADQRGIILVTHEPNAIGFMSQFAQASKQIPILDNGGAVGYKITAPNWAAVGVVECSAAERIFACRVDRYSPLAG